MQVFANLPLAGRDLRLDLFRGLANWAIFLDHIPHEVMSSITTKNYGFSDAADLFVFVSGYTAASVFGRIMSERGYAAAASRLLKRVAKLEIERARFSVREAESEDAVDEFAFNHRDRLY